MSKQSKRNRRFVSLNLKMTAIVMLGIVLAVAMYFACNWFSTYVANIRYLSDEAVERNVGAEYESLETYIKKNNVKATDNKALSEWVKGEEYTYCFVYDNFSNAFEAGWWVDPSEPTDVLADEDSSVAMNVDLGDDSRIDEESFTVDVKNRILEFADGKYYVYIDVYKEKHWYDIMDIATIILCFLTLLATVIIYNGAVMRRIIVLAGEVQQISDGDLKNEIHAIHNDELGSLSYSVDNMRNAIIEKLENEKAAWDANTQLITAMSHDIRTPLTSMIGYLDIIGGKKYSSQEELEKYICSCRDKAFQLKELSDKLFQYFLVFGNKERETKDEAFDGSILFEQLLSEHGAEIISYGYKVNFDFRIPEVWVNADISGLRRLFDNIFSNIMKYADKIYVVDISAYADQQDIKITIGNHILEKAKKVESTRIGVKTCEKICSDLKGTFQYTETDEQYTVYVSFPIVPKPDIEENQESGHDSVTT